MLGSRRNRWETKSDSPVRRALRTLFVAWGFGLFLAFALGEVWVSKVADADHPLAVLWKGGRTFYYGPVIGWMITWGFGLYFVILVINMLAQYLAWRREQQAAAGR